MTLCKYHHFYFFPCSDCHIVGILFHRYLRRYTSRMMFFFVKRFTFHFHERHGSCRVVMTCRHDMDHLVSPPPGHHPAPAKMPETEGLQVLGHQGFSGGILHWQVEDVPFQQLESVRRFFPRHPRDLLIYTSLISIPPVAEGRNGAPPWSPRTASARTLTTTSTPPPGSCHPRGSCGVEGMGSCQGVLSRRSCHPREVFKREGYGRLSGVLEVVTP